MKQIIGAIIGAFGLLIAFIFFTTNPYFEWDIDHCKEYNAIGTRRERLHWYLTHFYD